MGLRFIHVAGTNGKGSVCAMLESIYRTAGLRVGLFTSPHLVSFAERIQVNRRFISEDDVVRIAADLREVCGLRAGTGHAGDPSTPDSLHPTFFEFVTVMALKYFAEQKCDLVIWETGLGGRLDATNIVTPLASVITNIGIEHAEWLGDTVEKIAAEKAGIIKPQVPVITAATTGAGLEVIAEIAREHAAPLTVVARAESAPGNSATGTLPLHGPHQRMNAAVAVAVAAVLRERIPVPDEQVRRGLESVQWPGRMQRVELPSGQVLLLDGAHNAGGAEALRAALEEEFPGESPALIFGVFRDKDSAAMCRSLARLARRIFLTPVQSARSEDPAKLAAACLDANPRAPVTVCDSLREALERAEQEPFVVVAGSLYLIGEAMEHLRLATERGADEKPLNEWTGPARPKNGASHPARSL
jgi:dihydrofolate synthase/folylpolyglutamate synthase